MSLKRISFFALAFFALLFFDLGISEASIAFEKSVNLIPNNLQLKTSPLNVIHSTAYVDVVNGRKINKIKYAYMDKSVPAVRPFNGEDINKRTSNSYTKPIKVNNEGNEVLETTFFSKPQFTKDITGAWRQIEYATTTQKVFLASGAPLYVKKRELVEGILGTKKVFADSSTFYPDPHTETSTVDGHVFRTGAGWDGIHDDTNGSTVDDSATTFQASSNEIIGFVTIYRGFIYFDTSSISATDTIDSAVLSLYGSLKVNTDNDGDDFISIVQVQGNSVVSDTIIDTEDYELVGDAVDDPTEGHDAGDRIDITGISTSAYSTWTFNSTGLGWIARSGEQKPSGGTAGITYLGVREGHDILDNPITVSTFSRVDFISAETSGTSQDPKLVVTHTAAVLAKVIRLRGEVRLRGVRLH